MARPISRFFPLTARTFVFGALILSLLLGGVWLVERALGGSETDAVAAREEVFDQVQRRVLETLEGLEERAEEVSQNEALGQSLRRHFLSEPQGAVAVVGNESASHPSALTEIAFSALSPSPSAKGLSVEVYDAALNLVAWNGFAVPVQGGAVLPDTVVSRAVLDGSERRALVVWAPIRSDSVTVGAVRAALLVQYSVPVHNEYLHDYDIADQWRDELGAYFQMAIVPTQQQPVPEAEPLVGLSGEGVGWLLVSLSSPSVAELHRVRFFRDLRVWIVLVLMTWVLGWVGLLFVRAVQRSGEDRRRGNWLASVGMFLLLTAALIAFRFGLLGLDVPVRWLDAIPSLSEFFNPAVFGSNVGWGLLRSPGDLVLSVFIALVVGGSGLIVVLQYAFLSDGARRESRLFRIGARLLGAAAVAILGTGILGVVVRHAVLDATLRYFDQTGPVLTGPFVAVLGSLVILAGAVIFAIAGAQLVARAGFAQRLGGWLVPAATMAGAVLFSVLFTRVGDVVTALIGVATVLAGSLLAYVLIGRPERWVWPLTFRGILLGVLVVVPLTYGLMRGPLEEQRDARLAEAARLFSSGRDNRVLYALEQMFIEARSSDALQFALRDSVASDPSRQTGGLRSDSIEQVLDEIAAGLATGSLLGSLSDVAVEIRFLDANGDTLGEFSEGIDPPISSDHPLSFERIRERYATSGAEGNFVRSIPFEARRGLREYASLGPAGAAEGGHDAWIYVRATPRPARFAVETPFPRVLVPAEELGLGDERFTYAEYEDGVLVRSQGAESAPFRLDTTVVRALEEQAGALWSTEWVSGARVRSFYERIGDGLRDVVAVRAPARGRIDALYLWLRIALSGLIVGGIVYALGLPVRRRAGQLPSSRAYFRDKVLNRFLAIGLLSVLLTGIVGQRVLSEQNRQAVEDLLRQRLDRVESALTASAETGATAGQLLVGTGPETLINTIGFDVHLYRGADLLTSSRRQLVRQRLIAPRLAAEVYKGIYLNQEPYVFSEDRIGTFRYTTGYRALPDSTGRPVGVVAVPTLPEQAIIEAGQARMVAYLFGGLLVLMIVIVGIGVLLAGQLTRPFERLRQGLEAVGKGRLDEPIPVETRDEVGQLAESFNAMQGQLAESRRLLAEQERETAWSEMARQVAHEIKNPLMPMLLAVQHLQRLHRDPGESATSEERRFSTAFRRTTQMLVEQIVSLKRIASEFSVFARLPERHPERTDLNEIVKEAAGLFQSKTLGAEPQNVSVGLEFSSQPLPILADREEMRRVFVNLLANAFQALDGSAGEILLRTDRTESENGQMAVAEVTDTGRGIPPEAHSRIFQPSFSTKTSGMGLGLAIAKRGVEAAGGTIGFESAPGEGTTFRVRLPIATDNKA